MKITATVMAHPKRKLQAEQLFYTLKNYPFVNVSITYDEINEEWHTGKRALLDGIGSADWHVVIQDDAILCPMFYINLENAISALSEKTLISLYTGTARPLGGKDGRVTVAVANCPDGGWLRHHQLFWGVGIAIPTDHIQPMLEFVENIELPYDNKIGEFYCQNGLPVYYCIPSLVDHDDDLGTLIPGHGKDIDIEPRKAHKLAADLVNWGNMKVYI
jgi:hypothetical protein